MFYTFDLSRLGILIQSFMQSVRYVIGTNCALDNAPIYERRAMWGKLNTKLAGLALSAVCAGMFLAPAAQATPIAFNNVGNSSGATRFTIGCGSASGSCAGLLEAAITSTSPVTWSSTYGLALAGSSNASPTAEMTFLNGLLGTNFTTNSGNISPSGNGNSANFSFDGQYFMVKVGNGPTGQGYGLLQNISGGSLDLFFTAVGRAGGLSHYITFGTAGPTPVPEPGILAMFGLGLLFVGVGYGLRRRQSV